MLSIYVSYVVEHNIYVGAVDSCVELIITYNYSLIAHDAMSLV